MQAQRLVASLVNKLVRWNWISRCNAGKVYPIRLGRDARRPPNKNGTQKQTVAGRERNRRAAYVQRTAFIEPSLSRGLQSTVTSLVIVSLPRWRIWMCTVLITECGALECNFCVYSGPAIGRGPDIMLYIGAGYVAITFCRAGFATRDGDLNENMAPFDWESSTCRSNALFSIRDKEENDIDWLLWGNISFDFPTTCRLKENGWTWEVNNETKWIQYVSIGYC